MSRDDEREGPYWNSPVDQQIGSLLERFCTRDTGDYCRFCATAPAADEHDGDFCSEDCAEDFQTVMDARLVIGERDMDQRGYD